MGRSRRLCGWRRTLRTRASSRRGSATCATAHGRNRAPAPRRVEGSKNRSRKKLQFERKHDNGSRSATALQREQRFAQTVRRANSFPGGVRAARMKREQPVARKTLALERAILSVCVEPSTPRAICLQLKIDASSIDAVVRYLEANGQLAYVGLRSIGASQGSFRATAAGLHRLGTRLQIEFDETTGFGERKKKARLANSQSLTASPELRDALRTAHNVPNYCKLPAQSVPAPKTTPQSDETPAAEKELPRAAPDKQDLLTYQELMLVAKAQKATWRHLKVPALRKALRDSKMQPDENQGERGRSNPHRWRYSRVDEMLSKKYPPRADPLRVNGSNVK